MAKSRKCDRCGKFYLLVYQNTIVVGQWNMVCQWNGLDWERLNLCDDCKKDLVEWLKGKGDINHLRKESMLMIDTINSREIIDFALKGNVIRFYLGKNGEQWGDDWNDVPYEHNAEQVYDEYVSSIFDCYVPFDCLVLEPCNGCSNSPFCKEDMIKGKVPCVIIVPAKIAKESWNDFSFDYWLGNKDVIKVYFGDDISKVQMKIDDLAERS